MCLLPSSRSSSLRLSHFTFLCWITVHTAGLVDKGTAQELIVISELDMCTNCVVSIYGEK